MLEKLYVYTKSGRIEIMEVIHTTIGGEKVSFVSKAIVVKDKLVFHARPEGLTVTPLNKWSPCGTYYFSDNYADAAMKATLESTKAIMSNRGLQW